VNKILSLSNVVIGYLCGDVLSVYDDRCIVHVGGVGYVVRACQRFLGCLSRGDSIKVWIEHIMHENESSLFGFENEREQKWFRWLIAVPGVGGRAALQILSAFPPDDLCCVLRERRAQDLRRAEGVGPKLAERLVTELARKAEQQGSVSADGILMGDLTMDAVMALCQLGYSRAESEKAVHLVVKDHPQLDVSAVVSRSLDFFK
jgi:Holliday junction DNA helicase RuvA